MWSLGFLTPSKGFCCSPSVRGDSRSQQSLDKAGLRSKMKLSNLSGKDEQKPFLESLVVSIW